MEIKCPGCTKFIDADSKFCPSCGRAMTAETVQSKPARVACPDGNCTGIIGENGRCRKCGAEKGNQAASQIQCPYCSELIQKKALKCKHCGEFLDSGQRSRSRPGADKKDKTIAAILAFFLGGIGIHKFYLQQGTSGVIRLLFCWTFIPAFLGLFDGIGLLMSSQDDFDQRYNR